MVTTSGIDDSTVTRLVSARDMTTRTTACWRQLTPAITQADRNIRTESAMLVTVTGDVKNWAKVSKSYGGV
jgi:hypothetical protein